jgi:hypothetical protein
VGGGVQAVKANLVRQTRGVLKQAAYIRAHVMLSDLEIDTEDSIKKSLYFPSSSRMVAKRTNATDDAKSCVLAKHTFVRILPILRQSVRHFF